jgi:hypothetical protein
MGGGFFYDARSVVVDPLQLPRYVWMRLCDVTTMADDDDEREEKMEIFLPLGAYSIALR